MISLRFVRFLAPIFTLLLIGGCSNRDDNCSAEKINLKGKWVVVETNFSQHTSRIQQQNRSDFGFSAARVKHFTEASKNSMVFNFQDGNTLEWIKPDGTITSSYRFERKQKLLHFQFSLLYLETISCNEIKFVDENLPFGYKSEFIAKRKASR